VSPAADSRTVPAGIRVLVVDDDPDLRGYIRSCLRRVGGVEPRIIEALDGAEALAVARRAPPDVVISDVVMPGLDGVSLARAGRVA
jgi:CheY-like chemotaxis protein